MAHQNESLICKISVKIIKLKKETNFQFYLLDR